MIPLPETLPKLDFQITWWKLFRRNNCLPQAYVVHVCVCLSTKIFQVYGVNASDKTMFDFTESLIPSACCTLSGVQISVCLRRFSENAIYICYPRAQHICSCTYGWTYIHIYSYRFLLRIPIFQACALQRGCRDILRPRHGQDLALTVHGERYVVESHACLRRMLFMFAYSVYS